MMAAAPGVSVGSGAPCSAAMMLSMAMIRCVTSIAVVVDVVGGTASICSHSLWWLR